MPKPIESTVHVLLFKCSQCGGPLSATVVNHTSSVEQIDERAINVRCPSCKWTDTLVGTEAKRHWVAPWESDARQT